MVDALNLDRSETLVFKIDSLLKRDIDGEKISTELIEKFGELADDFENIGNAFFKRFNNNTMDQITAFGASITTKNICLSIKEGLDVASINKQNPIKAKEVLGGNYLMYIHIILNSFKTINASNRINNEEFMILNESVRHLIKNSKEHQIYKEEAIEFKNKESENILIEVLREETIL